MTDLSKDLHNERDIVPAFTSRSYILTTKLSLAYKTTSSPSTIHYIVEGVIEIQDFPSFSLIAPLEKYCSDIWPLSASKGRAFLKTLRRWLSLWTKRKAAVLLCAKLLILGTCNTIYISFQVFPSTLFTCTKVDAQTKITCFRWALKLVQFV